MKNLKVGDLLLIKTETLQTKGILRELLLERYDLPDNDKICLGIYDIDTGGHRIINVRDIEKIYIINS